MKLLVVEDETRMRQLLRRGLMEDGHSVDVCENAAQALESVRYADYDVIVLDWGLPDEDGLSLLRHWRAEGISTPVLMLTARGSLGERVLGLRSGADDYLVKPFDFEELVARVAAIHRRSTSASTGSSAFGDLRFERLRREIVGPRGAVELTSREFQLMNAFVDRPGDVRTRGELLSKVWGTNFDGEPNVIDVYVGYLRAKIDATGAQLVSIATIRGTGYRFVVATSPIGGAQ